MQRPMGVAAETWLRQCMNQAQEVPMDDPLKANYLADLAILSGLVYNLETIMAIIAEETMYESSVVQYFTEKALEQEGREILLEVLALRFQPEDMDQLASRIGRSAMYNGSSSCVGRPYRRPRSKPLGTC